jgi:hypothetical protein
MYLDNQQRLTQELGWYLKKNELRIKTIGQNKKVMHSIGGIYHRDFFTFIFGPAPRFFALSGS